jgi:hypothetical protein
LGVRLYGAIIYIASCPACRHVVNIDCHHFFVVPLETPFTMKRFLFRGLGASVVAALTVSATPESSENPLATTDQQSLDALAIEISNDDHFVVLKAEAKAAFQTAHGLPISDEAASSLDEAIDELAFSSIQKAVNTDAFHPKIYWVDAGPRNWFGLDVPGGRYSYDNPDCFFRTIPIDHSLSYVVKGYRHTPGPADVTSR